VAIHCSCGVIRHGRCPALPGDLSACLQGAALPFSGPG
jgi:hypothetical protein